MRRAGIGAIKNRSMAQAKFKDKGGEMADSELQQMTKQVDTFRSFLEEFAAKHKDKIRKNAEFRSQFQAMCAAIGVDPLASSKGVWSEIIGVGDFYYQLGVKIIEVCMATSHRNGGLMDINDLCTRLNKVRTSHESEISVDDIVRSIKKLNALGNGFSLVTLGSHQFVQSVPGELSMDQTSVLGLAEATAHVTVGECVDKLNWTTQRAQKALNQMVKDGVAWVDDIRDLRTFWFPSLFQSLHSTEIM